MNAFRFKPDHQSGAGECVSLACLYVAAMFIVAGVPLEDIYMMGTPLHSQNFILIDEGVITNNRRIVTKSMWYNGTELSALARRALEHEEVTIVAHPGGYIHSVYPEATIDPAEYKRFRDRLSRFLETQVNFEIFINFLRDYSRYQKLFQIVFSCQGTKKFIRLERAFGYEHGSKNRLGEKTGRKLLCEMDEEEMNLAVYPGRLVLSSDDEIFKTRPYQEFIGLLTEKFPGLKENHDFITDLKKFVHLIPRIPSDNKSFLQGHRSDRPSHTGEPDSTASRQSTTSTTNEGRDQGNQSADTILPSSSREDIIGILSSRRANDPTADLAFYAGRFMDSCDWKPFLKAAFERNPVSVDNFAGQSPDEIFSELRSWPGESIYEGNRLAMPDEVVNYKRGDGMEKAITLMNILKARHLGENIQLTVSGSEVKLKGQGVHYEFSTLKSIRGLD